MPLLEGGRRLPGGLAATERARRAGAGTANRPLRGPLLSDNRQAGRPAVGGSSNSSACPPRWDDPRSARTTASNRPWRTRTLTPAIPASSDSKKEQVGLPVKPGEFSIGHVVANRAEVDAVITERCA